MNIEINFVIYLHRTHTFFHNTLVVYIKLSVYKIMNYVIFARYKHNFL